MKYSFDTCKIDFRHFLRFVRYLGGRTPKIITNQQKIIRHSCQHLQIALRYHPLTKLHSNEP